MKTWAVAAVAVAAAVAAAVCGGAAAAPAQAQTWDLIDLAAISRMSPRELEMLAEGLAVEEMIRTKRSSSAHALGQIATKVSSGLSSSVGLLGQASAGASSFISAASSKGDEHHGYSYEPHEEEKPKYDFWGLKKSILNTLFQAVKAITGGVTIIKGQIIKGGGALAAVAGKIISVKGDAVSNLGKKIVNSAQLSPPKKHHAPPPSYGPPPSVEYLPSAYGAPPAHAPAHYAHTGHSAPSGPSGPGFTAPSKYTSHYEGRGKPLSGLHAGVILLQPLESEHSAPPHHDHHQAPSAAHTALEPPNSFLSSAFKALKGVFKGSPAPVQHEEHVEHIEHEHPPSHDHEHPPSPDHEYTPSHDHNSIHFPPPPPPPPPAAGWGAPLNSYGEPANSYFHPYADHNSHDSYDVAMSKQYKKPKGFSPEKFHKISENLNKLTALQRSSEEVPLFDNADLYRKMLEKQNANSIQTHYDPRSSDAMSANAMYLNLNSMSLNATPDLVDSLKPLMRTVAPTTDRPTTTEATSTTDQTSASSGAAKYVLRGNRIVQV